MSIKATQPEDSAVKKMTPGDDLHLTLLGVPMGWNFLIGQDRAEMLTYGRAVWNAALATPSPQPAATKEAAGEALQLRSWIDTAIEAITDGDTGSKATALSALRKAQAAAVDGMTAWRDYAQHLEWCATCAQDSVGSCHEGTALKEAAAIATQEGGHD